MNDGIRILRDSYADRPKAFEIDTKFVDAIRLGEWKKLAGKQVNDVSKGDLVKYFSGYEVYAWSNYPWGIGGPEVIQLMTVGINTGEWKIKDLLNLCGSTSSVRKVDPLELKPIFDRFTDLAGIQRKIKPTDLTISLMASTVGMMGGFKLGATLGSAGADVLMVCGGHFLSLVTTSPLAFSPAAPIYAAIAAYSLTSGAYECAKSLAEWQNEGRDVRKKLERQRAYENEHRPEADSEYWDRPWSGDRPSRGGKETVVKEVKTEWRCEGDSWHCGTSVRLL